MARTAAKSVALTVAAGVITFGMQQLSIGETTTGGVAIVIGALLFVGYQMAEETDHTEAYNDVVERIGEETFERLSEMTAEELDRRFGSLDLNPHNNR